MDSGIWTLEQKSLGQGLLYSTVTDFTTDNFPGVIDANQWVEDARWDVAGPTSARFQRDKISGGGVGEQHKVSQRVLSAALDANAGLRFRRPVRSTRERGGPRRRGGRGGPAAEGQFRGEGSRRWR